MLQLTASRLHFEQIATWQMVTFKETTVLVFNGKIKSPKIPSVLVLWTLIWFVNDPQLDPMRVRCRDSNQVKQTETYTLKHPLFTSRPIIALLDTSPQIDFVPSSRI